MEPTITTVGQMLINSAIPAEYQDHTRVWDKNSVRTFLTDSSKTMAPDDYRDMVQKLSMIGLKTARQSSASSFSLESLKPPKVKQQLADVVRKEVKHILRTVKDPTQRDAAIVAAAMQAQGDFATKVYDEAFKSENPFAMQVYAGARGNKAQLSSMIGADLMYSDNKGRPVPIPVLNS